MAGLALVCAADVLAQDDPPGRVGRVAELQGRVLWFDHEEGQWVDAERNRPLTGGDRFATAADGHVQLRIGSTTLRLGRASELEVVQLDDERLVFQLHAGQLALRVRSREVAREIEVGTPEARLQPVRSGHYRIDRVDDSTWVGSWRGEVAVADRAGLAVAAGQRLELYRETGTNDLRHAWGPIPEDEFAAWAVREDQRDDQRSASYRYVSPEMTGVEDLDRYGRWDQHPEYGAIWYPLRVQVGWAPYRYGRWAWVRPWGWTWIDEAPWGFAPFHYGRWVWWGGRWGWAPGGYVVRPVFAPALVAWVGGANWGVTVNIGGPAVGWVPLAPFEVYQPWYRHTPRYRDRVSVPPLPPRHPGQHPPPPRPHVPTGPVMYSNIGVPGGVTVVPRDVLASRQPVGRAVVTVPNAVTGSIVASPAPPALSPSASPRGPEGSSHARPVGPPGSTAPPAPAVPRTAPAAPPQAAPTVQPVPGGAVPLPPTPVGRSPGPPGHSGPGPATPPPAATVPAPRPGPPPSAEGRSVPVPRRPEPAEAGDPRRTRPSSSGGQVAPAAPAAAVGPAPSARPPTVPAPGAAAPRVAPAQSSAPSPSPPPVPVAAPQVAPAPRPAPPSVVMPPPRPPEAKDGRERDDERKRIPEPRPPSRDREAVR
jgi:hypothetical protein